MNKRGRIAIIEILILLIGIISMGYILGSEFKLVSGQDWERGYYKGSVWQKNNAGGWLKNIKTNELKQDFDSNRLDYIQLQQPPPALINPTTWQWPKGLSFENGETGFKIIGSDGKDIIGIRSKVDGNFFQAKNGDIYKYKDGKWELSQKGQGHGSTASEFLGTYAGGYLDAIVSGAQWAIIAYGIVQMVGPMLGMKKEQVDAASYAAMAGAFTGKSLYTLIGEGGKWSEGFNTKIGWDAGWTSFGVAVVIAIVVYMWMYKEASTEIVSYTCNPWDAPTGGAKCEECNKQGILPCSEYQCRSLGQSCQLLNPGTSEEKCAWVNRKDVNPPEIKPWEDALLPDYNYNPDNTISPPDRGVKVINEDSTTGCAKAFTPFTFGINTNEPAKCKIDYIRKQNFSNMQFFFGGSSTLKYNHTQAMSLPGPSALKAENLTLENNGEFSLFVICEDSNGNSNKENFVFKYCVEKGPDTTPPLIITTNLLNGMPIAYNQSSVDFEAYVNEPATCKWSRTNQDYDDMEETMSCATGLFEMNAQMLYKCSTKLIGLKDRQDNKFYFRCRDIAENKNTESQPKNGFVIKGTQPLVIDEVLPNGTIKDSTDSVKVTLKAKTSAGYNEGYSTCYYSETGDDNDYIMFFYEAGTNNSDYKHSQDLWLLEGNYKYYMKCIDLGGNSDIKNISFSVDVDNSAPAVVRVYHEESYLKLITNEEANCVYDTKTCNYQFSDGIELTNVDDINHYTDWDTKTNFYIKCQDEYGNQPLPNECSIIARPLEIF